jgi:hypothetical protein
MVEHLPASSAAHRAHAGHSWSDEHYMLAELTDRLGDLLELTRAVNSEDETFHSPPRIPRPGDAERDAAAEKKLEADKRAIRAIVDQLLPKG